MQKARIQYSKIESLTNNTVQKNMSMINTKQEWEFLVGEFNSPRFCRRTKKQKERWFNSQLLLVAIENVVNNHEKKLLSNFYFKLKGRKYRG